MKIHIENLSITVQGQQPPIGLLGALISSGAATSSLSTDVPAIGEKWPGTEAIYAGVSLSKTDDSLVHLLLWPDDPTERMNHEKAVKHAEGVKPDMESHLPTRHQSITLFDRLRDRFNQDYYHWTLTKTKSGNAACIQDFNDGSQGNDDLSSECRVRAVSEIPL
jgi:hypothetical protein